MIRLAVPSIDETDLEAVRQSISSGYLVQGKNVAEFERLVAELAGVPHAIAVANGTCALHLALTALDIGPGDICVVPTYSWVATANVVELCRAKPVFVDIDSRTFNIDAESLSEKLDDLMSDSATAARVKAVIPVHAFGQMADMSAINAVCSEKNVPVIEDAACALGAAIDGCAAGSLSSFGCFSFHPRKAITTGEGGMITTRDEGLARTVRALRNHGADPDSSSPDFVMAGFNSRLTDFQGALGRTQMMKLSRIIRGRRDAAARYDAALAGSVLTVPFSDPRASHVYQSYVTLLPERAASSRDRIIREARQQGVELQIGTIHMPMTTFFRKKYGFKRGDFPVTDDVSGRALTLPLFETIKDEEQQRVVDVTLSLVA